MSRPLSAWLFVVFTLLVVHGVSAQVPSGPGDWPQWRGPNRTGLSTEKGYARSWPQEGPKLLWQVDTVGVGYSSLSIKDGLIITQGDIDGVEHVLCVKVADGSTVWAVQPEPVAAALAEKIAADLKRMDKDGDGTLDEAEALGGLGPDFNNFDRADKSADPQQLAANRVTKLVKLLDADADGKLTFAEIGTKLRQTYGKVDQVEMGVDSAALAKQRTDELFKNADKDTDGKLTRNESNGTVIQEGFARADQRDPATNMGDNSLTREEVETYFAKQEGGKDGVLTVAELTKYYAANYAGKDGQLSKDELRGYLGGYRNGYGDGPRGTPTIDGKLVYAEGGNGDLTCLDLATGKTVWYKNLAKDFGGGRPGWGYCESPLVVGDMLIVTPGGAKGTLAALNKYTGEELWRSTDITEGAHYSSPQVVELAGIQQIVQFASKNAFGVRLDNGKLLWTYSKASNGTANVSTPLVYRDHVYATSNYGVGGGLVKVTAAGDKVTADEVYFDKTLANHHGGVLLIDEHIYGFGNGGLICQNFFKGDNVWRARSVGKGSLTYADGLLFLLGENHEMALAEASPGEYRELGRFKLENFGRQSWAHPVVAGGKLFIRNMQRLAAYDVSAK
ncbi:MAG: PQQ-binding-like beta-propeller repeat protein [Planctomycetaceae bacterium]|nr:PQQ-binding-like beta-propeller repeat protein [Planctomycetaceae bacterium]